MQANGRIEILHLLRGVAALSVCLFHFAGFSLSKGSLLPEGNVVRELSSYGYLGVHVFFIISGFLVPYSAYLKGYSYSNWLSFLKRRLIRIEPPYIVSVLIMFTGYLLVFSYKDWHFPWTVFDLIYNLTYMVEWVDGKWFNVTYWTLAVEFQFYILLMFTLPLFFHKSKGVRWITYLVLFLLAYFINSKSFLLGHWSLFMLGLVTSQYQLNLWTKMEYLLLAIASFLLVYLQYKNVDSNVFVVAAIAIVVFHLFKKMKAVNGYLGDISYSLYITHCIILAFVYGIGLELWNGWVNNTIVGYLLVLIGVLVSIGFAHLFYKCIERPAQNLSRKVK